MLTDQETGKLIDAFKDVFATRTEIEDKFDDLKENFSVVQSSIDTYSQKADTYFQEMLLLSRKVDRYERWLKEIAGKLGMELRV